MQVCKKCNVSIRNKSNKCPLCQGTLSGNPDSEQKAFPDLTYTVSVPRRMLSWAAFGSVVVFAICVTINLILPLGGWWSLFVLAGLASLWLSFALMIKERKNLLKGMLWLVAAISLFSFIWDYFTGFRGWSIDYVIPILCSCEMVAMVLVAKIRKLQIQDNIMYLIIACIFGIFTFVLLMIGAVKVIIPSAICFGASIIFLASLLFFEGKTFIAEIQRRLHL